MISSRDSIEASPSLPAAHRQLPWLTMLVVAIALLIPHLLSLPNTLPNAEGMVGTIDKSSWNFGLPRIYSGDEPHYLIQLYSLIEDGDLDLRNNYDAISQGSAQAGKLYAGTELNRHVSWYHKGVYYDPVTGTPPADMLPPREYSRHPPALVWLMWPFTVWFRGTTLVEPVAVIVCGLATVAAVYFYALLIAPYAQNTRSAAIAIVLAFLATPVWHYGRTLFTEPFLLLFGIAAVAVYLRKSQWLLSGALFAAAALLKSPFGLVAVPFAIDLLFRRNWRGCFAFCAPMAIAVGVTLLNNYAQHGSPLAVPQRMEWGNPFVGGPGQLYAWRKGMLLFAPVLLLAICWWPRFFRSFTRDAVLILAALAGYFLLHSCYRYWDGGYCYGPRYNTPLLPLLLAPLAMARREDFQGRPVRTFAAVFIAGASLLFSMVAAVPYWTCWNIHPVIYMLARGLH